MKISQLGTFDVENYGDLLFPLLAEWRLKQDIPDVELLTVSPRGGPPVWDDCHQSVRYDHFVSDAPDVAGLLIGGGNIVRTTPTNLESYAVDHVPLLGYANLWLGIAFEPHIHAPICWNAPGSSQPFSSSLHDMICRGLERASYVSVRDEVSREYLLKVSPGAEVAVVPDPAWDLPHLWPIATLEDAYAEGFRARGMDLPERSVAIHVNSRYIKNESIETIALGLDSLSKKLDAKVIVLGLGPCHGDDGTARELAGAMATKPLLLDRPVSLREVAAMISGSIAYLGSSMHGFITASAYGVPAVVVASKRMVKFPGLLSQMGEHDMLCENWPLAIEKLPSLLTDDHRRKLSSIQADFHRKLSNHWSLINGVFLKGRISTDASVLRPSTSAYREAVLSASAFEALARAAHVGPLKEQLSKEVERSTAHRAEVKEAHSYSEKVKVERDQALEVAKQSDATVKHLKKLLQGERRARQAIYGSASWRLTRPLRGASHSVRWIVRNTRRLIRLLGWIAKGQFPRAAAALHPYYHHFVPPSVRRRVPAKMISWIQNHWLTNPISVPSWIEEKAVAGPDIVETTGRQLDLSSSTFNSRRPYEFPGQEYYRSTISEYRVSRAKRSTAAQTAIFTAVAGGYDSIKIPEHLDPNYDYHLFVDTEVEDVGLFDIHELDYFNIESTRSARFVKTHPHLLLPGYDIAVWIDGNIVIRESIQNTVDAFLASGQALAAVPHPLRRSVFEEAAECIKRNKDDAELISAQMARYKIEEFDCEDLIESNFLMFNLKHPEIGNFLDLWWREIDRGSRRDQLSLNYALKKTRLSYFHLTERPNSVRNHPSLALLAHDSQLPSSSKPRRIASETFSPWSGESYSEVKDARLARYVGYQIDIIICVHNAIEDVRACLKAIERSGAGSRQRIIIVDDGSASDTQRFLAEFADGRPDVLLHRNDVAGGYTRAANIGLNHSTAPFLILLNSDTVVTHGWAEKLLDALYSTTGAGLVGPLSNAASHQSIPDPNSTRHQTAVNDLPSGLTADDMNAYCERWAPAKANVRTSLAHGFCLGISRAVIDKIGGFDEENFPMGYGEENDYCFRAMDAGFSCTIAVNTYVWHTKSKSYADEQRRALVQSGNAKVHALHGRRRVIRAIQSMRENPVLQAVRERAEVLYSTLSSDAHREGRHRD